MNYSVILWLGKSKLKIRGNHSCDNVFIFIFIRLYELIESCCFTLLLVYSGNWLGRLL